MFGNSEQFKWKAVTPAFCLWSGLAKIRGEIQDIESLPFLIKHSLITAGAGIACAKSRNERRGMNLFYHLRFRLTNGMSGCNIQLKFGKNEKCRKLIE